MAEAEYVTRARLPRETIWEYVSEMDNWARFVTGYQRHEKRSDTESLWTLKGDVGVLARTLTFQVSITEWAGPERVRFALKGLNESMEGSGTFTLDPDAARAGPAETAVTTGAPAPPPRRRGPLARLLEALARFFLRRRAGAVQRDAAERAAVGGGDDTTRLTFRLRLDPGGPMAPMVNAMIQPLMLPAAEDLANRILAELEERHGAGA